MRTISLYSHVHEDVPLAMSQTDGGVGSKLSPETILHAVCETEDKLWGQGGITDTKGDNLHPTASELGTAILQHAAGIRRTHSYFKNLEQRKCCLLLAACKQTFDCVRLVRNDGRDSGIEEGAMMKTSLGNTYPVDGLSAEEFRVLQHTLVCAAFPVLGAPAPPTDMTPSPVSPYNEVPIATTNRVTYQGVLARMNSHDSGVEEQTDTANVPSETLCELLRRSFRLSAEKFKKYEETISENLDKKSPQKILAEELVRQLIALENNSNPFYHPRSFVNLFGYDQWQQRERTHITELIQKFWHYNLPNPSQSTINRLNSMTGTHQEYVMLLEKLISYESPYRQENALISLPPTSPLSSASVRLLKEFGLRYGVGEQFRKVAYLHYLAMNFDPTVWFVEHVTASLAVVMDLLPSKRSCLVIVNEEYSHLETSLQLLEAKASAAIVKMKTLFPGNKPVEGIHCLIELLSLVLQVKSYLFLQPEASLGIKLHKLVQTIFPTAYERHKMVAKDELRQNKWTVDLNPKLLNMIIGKIRDEVQDYRQNYQETFLRYFNITLEAAREFYLLLMADVAELQIQSQDSMTNMEIDLLQLSLAYRLNQLDTDWNRYISPQMQTWRDSLLPKFLHWSVVMKVHMQDLVTEVVSLDKYASCTLHLTGSVQSSSVSDISGLPSLRVSSSMRSLTQSVNSAFSTLSSLHSTPGVVPLNHPPAIEEVSTEENKPRPQGSRTAASEQIFTSVQERLSLSTPARPIEKRASSDPVTISNSSLLKGSFLGETARSLGHYDESSFLSFAHLRRGNSLPNIAQGEQESPLGYHGNIQGQNSDYPHSRSHNRNDLTTDGDVSPEIDELLSSKESLRTFDEERSECSGTLTGESEDSEDENGEFSFPPLQEVRLVASSPVSNVKCEPVHVFADNAGNTSVVRPTAVKPTQSSSTAMTTAQSTSGSSPEKFTLKSKVLEQVKNQSKGEQQNKKTTNILQHQHQQFSSLDSHGSSELDHLHTNAMDFRGFNDSLTESLISNVSFPEPSPRSSVATVPISSSTIDIVVILQRIVSISKTLCQTLSPYRNYIDSDHSNLTSSDEDFLYRPPVNSSFRQKLYDSFLNCICHTICTYADNMLCMDLCGTATSNARRLAGPQLIEYLRTQQQSGIIWGCRHNLTGEADCFQFINKRAEMLCDRHEPVTREMCVRINNVMSMLTYLETYHRRLSRVFSIRGDWSVKAKSSSLQGSFDSSDFTRSDFVMVEDYGYNSQYDRGVVLETVSQRCPSSSGDSQSSTQHQTMVVSSPIDTYKNHLMAVLRGQCRILAYRLNLFVRDALPVLLSLITPGMRIEIGLKSITDFLRNYIAALQGWLYKDSFRRVLECLWIFIVQDFELELKKLEESNYEERRNAELLLQALSHFLKFMNSQHASLKKELLLSEADGVCFKLNLYSSPTSQLISVYMGLQRETMAMEMSSMDSQYQTAMLIRQRIQHDLLTLRKCFSGTDLIQWIINNHKLFVNFDPFLFESRADFTRDTAFHVAQRLLEWCLIADVEKVSSSGFKSPIHSLERSTDFPDLTIVSQLYPLSGAGMSRNRTISMGSDDSTPQATPRATPRPNLRASIRAASRHSALKSSTRSKTGPQVATSAFIGNTLKDLHNSSLERSTSSKGTAAVASIASIQCQSSDSHTVKDLGDDNPVRDGSANSSTSSDTQSQTNNDAVLYISSKSDVKIPVTISACKQNESFDDEDFNSSDRYKELSDFHGDNQQDSGVDTHTPEKGRPYTGTLEQGNQSLDSGQSDFHREMSRDFDPYLCTTPTSVQSAMSSSSRNVLFLDSSEVFYYVCPIAATEDNSYADFELLKLVEECLQKRVSSEYVLRVIYSRRKSDLDAKNFFKTFPVRRETQHDISFLMGI